MSDRISTMITNVSRRDVRIIRSSRSGMESRLASIRGFMATSSQLRKWRRLLLVRDSREVLPGAPRLSVCALCGPDVYFRTWQVQAHHIYPKSLHPEKALMLKNGVMVCAAHHQGIVHNHNPGMDIRNRDFDSGWMNFRHHFNRWNDLAINRRYNEQEQYRLTP